MVTGYTAYIYIHMYLYSAWKREDFGITSCGLPVTEGNLQERWRETI